MQSFYQFIVDDLAELGQDLLSLEYNKKYKKLLKTNFSPDNIFYVAYTIDIVSQEM